MGKAVDFLIVGQGIAGTLLAHFLLEKGARVHLIDAADPSSASRVAAGIINPVTGRYFVKSWRIEELIPFARKTYRAIEDKLGIDVYHERGLIRSIFNVKQENDWLSRTGDPTYAPYLQEDVSLGNYAAGIEAARSYGEVRQAAQVDIGEVVEAYQQYFSDRGWFNRTRLDYTKVQIDPDRVSCQGISAGEIVFCEGFWAQYNPFFNYLPFRGDKGDVLIVRIPKMDFAKILKHRVFIVPLKDDLYWIGATYVRDFDAVAPTPDGKEELLRRLKATLRIPFEVVEHRAAVRPTVKDRRPFLGRHPEFSRLAVFNGLGTKGTSLGPFFACQMAGFLIDQSPLDPEVNINRFPYPPTDR